MIAPYPLQLVYVEWDDADSIARWMERSEVDRYIESYNPIRQAGFILDDSKDRLVIAGSICPADAFKDETFGNVLRIPKPWIHTRRNLLTVDRDGTITRNRRSGGK